MHILREKKERRLGEKLFLKRERCSGPKCALTRRGYPPGVHGKTRRRRRERSEFGTLLNEKQKVRFLYGLDDGELNRYSKQAEGRGGVFGAALLHLLERRLDTVVFRLGFAESRRTARQMISHGHITAGGKTVTAPSFRVRDHVVISIKASSLASPLFSQLNEHLQKYAVPRWLSLDADKKTGSVIGMPEISDLELTFDPAKIKEFYSK